MMININTQHFDFRQFHKSESYETPIPSWKTASQGRVSWLSLQADVVAGVVIGCVFKKLLGPWGI